MGESNFTLDPVIVRTSSRPQRGSREQLYLEALEESGDQFTFIIVVSLAVCGTLLLLVIVVLMVYMCHKKEKQLKGGQLTASASSSQHKAPSEGSASTGSTKSATMELY